MKAVLIETTEDKLSFNGCLSDKDVEDLEFIFYMENHGQQKDLVTMHVTHLETYEEPPWGVMTINNVREALPIVHKWCTFQEDAVIQQLNGIPPNERREMAEKEKFLFVKEFMLDLLNERESGDVWEKSPLVRTTVE